MSEPLSPMKAQVYLDPRPAEYFDRFHERARTRDPDPVYELVRMVTSCLSWTVFRARCIASDNVPAAGPVILAPNHFSFMDHFFLGAFVRRKVRYMAKSQLFSPPMQWIYTHGGVFPVRRGHRDEEAFITAETILGRGGCVAMYCEGGRQRTGTVSDTARPGIGRLVLETGAPVVPVAIHGSQRARNWKRLDFPRVTVRYGEPVVYPREESAPKDRWQAVADDILDRISRLHSELEQHGRRTITQRVREERRAARRTPRVAA
jgi:1-acyl-sn-glycerol-3-phosphate acyltransferase